MGEVVFFVALMFLEFVAPVLIVIGLIWGFFTWRKVRRERKSLAASKGDETAMSLERDRVKARRLWTLGLILVPLVFVAALYFGANFHIAVIIAPACAVVCFALASVFRKRYNANFKQNIVKAELSKVFDNLSYEPGGAFSADAIRGLGFFTHSHEIGGNDLITAEYKGIRFSQCDLGVRERYTVTVEDSDGEARTETRYRDIFWGRAMRFDADEEYKGTTSVVQADFDGAVTGVGERVETELAEFNENFQVFASSGVEALETLKPQVIEGISLLARAVSVPLALFFKGRAMYAFLRLNRDSFDVSGSHTLLEERELLRHDINLITDFLDTMYFKTGERVDAERARDEEILPAPGYETKQAARRAKAAAKKGIRKAGALLPYILSAIYIASAIYMLYRFPGTYNLDWNSEKEAMGLPVPTIGYAVVMGIFTITGLFTKPSAGVIALLLHFLFLCLNLSGGNIA